MSIYKPAFKKGYATLPQHHKQLASFLKNCREDMHEPDEQGIKATVVGDHLDNAFGDRVATDAIVGGYQELVVLIRNENKDTFHAVNLATLIALARLASFE